MKAIANTLQQPPLTAPCPWCEGDLVVEETVVACSACDIEVPLSEEQRVALAA
jgi:hypothetical protein